MNRDLTVQAAMAISGAAFASAMGRHASVFQTLFALSNARLGAWLPNPAHLMELQRNPRDWRIPLLPSIRRLPYLLRELAGRFPCDERLLLCTDGAHYDNLGLVELLRHRPRLVYCFDASGDGPPFARTLAEAITLAQEELGVVISLEDALGLVPGSGEPLEPKDTLARINARLSKSAVCVGTIDYGKANTNGLEKGTLVVAKAMLTPDMPYELLSYAATDPFFPSNSTGDQWFEHDQFNAYLLLGRHLARQAVEAADRTVPESPHITVVDPPAA